MSEYPFLHNLIVSTYQEGRGNNLDFDLGEYIKNNEEDFEDWVYCERVEPLEDEIKALESQLEEARKDVEILTAMLNIYTGSLK